MAAEKAAEKNVFQRLAEVRKAAPYLQKAKKGAQFNYVGSSDVLGALNEKINEVGLILIPEVTSHKVTVYERLNAKGNSSNEYFTEIDMIFTWVNIDNPADRVPVAFYSQGVDLGGEKGVGKALTYGEKNFMLKFFNIATDKEDPDAFQEKIDVARGPKMMTQEQYNSLRSLAEEYAALRGMQGEAGVLQTFDWLLNRSKIKSLDDATADQGAALIETAKALILKHKKQDEAAAAAELAAIAAKREKEKAEAAAAAPRQRQQQPTPQQPQQSTIDFVWGAPGGQVPDPQIERGQMSWGN